MKVWESDQAPQVAGNRSPEVAIRQFVSKHKALIVQYESCGRRFNCRQGRTVIRRPDHWTGYHH